MDVFRRLERRIESLLDGVIGGVFRGPLHPSELAGKIAREADLGSRSVDGVVTVPNRFVIAVNPDDMAGAEPPPELSAELERTTEELAVERGWRLDGPVSVSIRFDSGVAHGNPRCLGEFEVGPRPAWSVLKGNDERPIGVNHAVIGRGSDADVVLDSSRVSRRHARLWQEAGRVMIQDLDSSNGTAVDGVPVADRPVELSLPCVITLGDVVYRLDPR